MAKKSSKRTDYYSLETGNELWEISAEFDLSQKIKKDICIGKKEPITHYLFIPSLASLKMLRCCIDDFIELIEQQKESKDED